jgi:hypothetical protein
MSKCELTCHYSKAPTSQIGSGSDETFALLHDPFLYTPLGNHVESVCPISYTTIIYSGMWEFLCYDPGVLIQIN